MHVLHRDEVRAFGLRDVVDRDDAGMIQRGGGSGFLREALLALDVRDRFRRQDLDGDEAIEAGIARFVDDTHPSFAECRDDLRSGPGVGRSCGITGRSIHGGSRIDAQERGCAIERPDAFCAQPAMRPASLQTPLRWRAPFREWGRPGQVPSQEREVRPTC